MKIFRAIRSSQGAGEEEERIKEYINKQILVIDDLGVAKDSEFAAQTLYEIIDGRYMAMKGGLIITANLSLNEIALKIGDDRITSRLADMCYVIKLTGKDHRVNIQENIKSGKDKAANDY